MFILAVVISITAASVCLVKNYRNQKGDKPIAKESFLVSVFNNKEEYDGIFSKLQKPAEQANADAGKQTIDVYDIRFRGVHQARQTCNAEVSLWKVQNLRLPHVGPFVWSHAWVRVFGGMVSIAGYDQKLQALGQLAYHGADRPDGTARFEARQVVVRERQDLHGISRIRF